MLKKNYKYIYGPVSSWRLGSSLGIDPVLADGKTCTFDCVYCQLGKTKHLTDERKIFVPAEKIMEELNSLPPLEIDYITFSGMGEPTLAENLGDMIREIRKIRKDKIAVLTNSSMMQRKDVREGLLQADLVVAKLDAGSQKLFEIVNRPLRTLKVDSIVQAIKDFNTNYKGKLALQIMFIEESKIYIPEIVQIAKEINPDEVQINTPLRPCAAKSLSAKELGIIEGCFAGLDTVSVYKADKKIVEPVSKEDTLKRRGKNLI